MTTLYLHSTQQETPIEQLTPNSRVENAEEIVQLAHRHLSNGTYKTKEGKKWCNQAASLGDLNSLFHMGVYYLIEQNEATYNTERGKRGFLYLIRAATKGHSLAQSLVGKVYLSGVNGIVEKDPHKGIEWFVKADKQQNPSGPVRLGEMFLKGYYFDKRLLTAEVYFKNALDMEDDGVSIGEAHYFLYKCYKDKDFPHIERTRVQELCTQHLVQAISHGYVSDEEDFTQLLPRRKMQEIIDEHLRLSKEVRLVLNELKQKIPLLSTLASEQVEEFIHPLYQQTHTYYQNALMSRFPLSFERVLKEMAEEIYQNSIVDIREIRETLLQEVWARTQLEKDFTTSISKEIEKATELIDTLAEGASLVSSLHKIDLCDLLVKTKIMQKNIEQIKKLHPEKFVEDALELKKKEMHCQLNAKRAEAVEAAFKEGSALFCMKELIQWLKENPELQKARPFVREIVTDYLYTAHSLKAPKELYTNYKESLEEIRKDYLEQLGQP